ncbi:MAG: DUF1289 domain-containing protein [Pseudomonadota bacterium]
MPNTESPCIQVCVIDPSSGLCRGCARTIEEIGAWASMNSGERRRVMDMLAGRRAQQQQQMQQ